MKKRIASTTFTLTFVLLAALLAGCATGPQPEPLPTLKSAYKNHFYIGVAINRSVATGIADQTNRFFHRSQAMVDKDIALVKQQFNQITPENDLKWAHIQPEPGTNGYDFGPADAYVNFGLSNHMYIVGHTLIWDVETPLWVFQPPGMTNVPSPSHVATTNIIGTNALSAMTNSPLPAMAAGTNAAGTNGPPHRRFGRRFGRGFALYKGPRATREELLKRMRDHIFTVVGRYKGKIKTWDVVNEVIADKGTNLLRNSLWLQIIGPDYIAKAFEYAHEADPHAILRINDYALEKLVKRRKFITLVKSLLAQHVPVMAIGTQTHVNVFGPSYKQEDRALTDLEQLGLPIDITELDVNAARPGWRRTGTNVTTNTAWPRWRRTGTNVTANTEAIRRGLVKDANQRLAREYAILFKVFLKHQKHIRMVTFWGVNDSVSWLFFGRPLLFDGNDKPKPAFYAVIRAAEGAPPNPH